MVSIFTKIINKEIPGRIVWEDSICIAMVDIRPLNRGHVLVVPREEVDKWQTEKIIIMKGPIPVASTYYLLSRVIYAKIEQDKGTKPENLRYDSDLNMLAYDIPNMGELGAPSLWVWERGE